MAIIIQKRKKGGGGGGENVTPAGFQIYNTYGATVNKYIHQ